MPTTQLDNCNAFPLGLPQSQLMWCKMQLLYCWQIPRSKSILPLSWPLYTGSPSALGFNLKSSWLLLDGQAPTHISALAQPHSAHRSLRSADKDLLSLPRPASRDDRAFAITTPCLWNCLPPGIRFAPSISTFKFSLKTHFYTSGFSAS